MQCLRTVANQRKTLLALAALAAMLLSGCTETVRKVSHINPDAANFNSLASQDETSQLADKDPQTLVNTGWVYLANRNPTLAGMHFVMALKKDAQMAEAYIGLGKVDQYLGNNAGAEIKFRQALEIQPDQLVGLTSLAQVQRQQGKLDAASKTINQAMAVAPEDIRVMTELAMIYEQTGQSTLAEPIFREVADKAPDQAATHNNLGTSHLVHGDYDLALREFHQAASLAPQNKQIKNNLASAYILSGDDDTGLRIFKETVGEAAAYNNLGFLQMSQDRLAAAELSFRTALDLNPKFYQRAQDNLDRVKQLQAKRGQAQP